MRLCIFFCSSERKKKNTRCVFCALESLLFCFLKKLLALCLETSNCTHFAYLPCVPFLEACIFAWGVLFGSLDFTLFFFNASFYALFWPFAFLRNVTVSKKRVNALCAWYYTLCRFCFACMISLPALHITTRVACDSLVHMHYTQSMSLRVCDIIHCVASCFDCVILPLVSLSLRA